LGQNAMTYAYGIRTLSLAEGTNLSDSDLKTRVIKDQGFLLNERRKAKVVAADAAGKGSDSQEILLSTQIASQLYLSKVTSKMLESDTKWERTAIELTTLHTKILRC
jgi:hypothetical protein